jgi:predicted AlkP superfamily pyrophosphatase or phosphodiesterase
VHCRIVRLTSHTAAVAAACALLAFAVPRAPAAQSAAPPGPKLAVIIVVDQMRADYVDRFAHDWTRGLKRFVADGATFRRAAYPYLETWTCAGHATIATGVLPNRHGIIQNTWWDRDAQRQMTCTEDPRVSDIGYGVPVVGGDSAHRLLVPTFADQLRTGRGARVAAVALKDRSAIMLAGHGGDAVTWASDTVDGWMTSPVYSTAPLPAVERFIAANRMEADFGRTWTRLLPASRYTGPDDGVGEAPPEGWTRKFPHELKGTSQKPDATFFAQWERSPFADALVGRFAASLVESLKLGQHDTTDVLAVSFSSPDLVGHAFGPQSHELQDMYAQLDRTIGDLLDRIDALVGHDAWVAALTADHGVRPIPEQLVARHQDAGRIDSATIVTAIEQRLKKALGEGPHVAIAIANDIYFERGVYDKIQASPKLLASVVDAVAGVPGVLKVFRSEEVRGGGSARDPLLRAAALSYFPGRSGDLIVISKPEWQFNPLGTTHGSATEHDQHVPLMFLGRGVKAGRFDQPATPADLAPTLAALCGSTMTGAEGHALTAAIQEAPRRSHQ